jgi:hypothetical protein
MSEFEKGFAKATGVELLQLAEAIASFCGDANPDGPGAAEGLPPVAKDIFEALVMFQSHMPE